MGKFLKNKTKKNDADEPTPKKKKAPEADEPSPKKSGKSKKAEKTSTKLAATTKKTKKKEKAKGPGRNAPRIVSKSKNFPRIEVNHKDCGSAQVSRDTLERIKILAQREGCRAFDVTEKFLLEGLTKAGG